ncbi:MAG: imidazole glycerol phosphate synthase subunit HisH [Armatimonadetes bacterium]|nr:imidazole glycerol phosphate synthase subunit HisH [Armatimonadota bacterium]MDE2208007.1 imidazole glycerol phosphate synthase subunit HisH [Armatimonadota bacterium]
MIAIVDYGMANLRSVERALRYLGAEACITAQPDEVDAAAAVVLPGVGAFAAAMNNLRESGLQEAVARAARSGKPFLGICLGLQMLFDSSTEMCGSEGLGLFRGTVVRLGDDPPTEWPLIKVPHIGWNQLCKPRPSRLLDGICSGEEVYFVHSYYPVPTQPALVVATAEHGRPFCAAVESGNVAATQFHPEKSGDAGLRILRNFISWN